MSPLCVLGVQEQVGLPERGEHSVPGASVPGSSLTDTWEGKVINLSHLGPTNAWRSICFSTLSSQDKSDELLTPCLRP